MKTYTAKTEEEAVELACSDLNVLKDELSYKVIEVKNGLLNKKTTIEVYELPDIIAFAEDYILAITDALEIEACVKTKLDDEIIHMDIDSVHNPILIGKNGVTLHSLNELVKLAVFCKYNKRLRILLDINGYKEKKYSFLRKLARKYAHQVADSKTTYTFDPMPSDERRIIHNAIADIEHVKSESTGEGKRRQVQLIYVE